MRDIPPNKEWKQTDKDEKSKSNYWNCHKRGRTNTIIDSKVCNQLGLEDLVGYAYSSDSANSTHVISEGAPDNIEKWATYKLTHVTYWNKYKLQKREF